MHRNKLILGAVTCASLSVLAWFQLDGAATANPDPLPEAAEELKESFESATSIAVAVRFTDGPLLESFYGTIFGDSQGNFAYVARDNGRTHTLQASSIQLLTHHPKWGDDFEPVIRASNQWMAGPVSDFWPDLIAGSLDWLDRRPGYYDYPDGGGMTLVEVDLPYEWADQTHVFMEFHRSGWTGIRIYLPDGSDRVIAIEGVQWNQPLPSELFTGRSATTTWFPKQPGHNPNGGLPPREDKPENPGPLMHLSEWRELHDTGG